MAKLSAKMTIKAHEAAAVVKTLFTISNLPVQQQEVGAVLDIDKTTAHTHLKNAVNLRLLYDLETRDYQPSLLVPFSAISVKFPTKPKTKATPAEDLRSGWLF